MRVLSGKRAWMECVILLRVLGLCIAMMALQAASQMLVVLANLAKTDPLFLGEVRYRLDGVHSGYEFFGALPTLLYEALMFAVGKEHYEVVGYLFLAILPLALSAASFGRLGPSIARRLVARKRVVHV